MPSSVTVGGKSERQVEERRVCCDRQSRAMKTVQRLAAEDNALKTGADALTRNTVSSRKRRSLRTRCG